MNCNGDFEFFYFLNATPGGLSSRVFGSKTGSTQPQYSLFSNRYLTYFCPGLLEALIEHWRASLIAVFDVGRDLELGNTKTDAMRKRKREKQENSTKGLRWSVEQSKVLQVG